MKYLREIFEIYLLYLNMYLAVYLCTRVCFLIFPVLVIVKKRFLIYIFLVKKIHRFILSKLLEYLKKLLLYRIHIHVKALLSSKHLIKMHNMRTIVGVN